MHDRREIHFERGGAWWHFCAAMSVLGVFMGSEGGLRLWLGFAALALGAADLAWSYWNPILTITPHSIIVRAALLRPRRELPLSQIYSWAHTSQTLAFRTQDGRLTEVAFSLIPAARRAELLALLESLGLQRPGPAPLDAHRLRQRFWRTLALVLAISLAFTGVAIWWTFRNGAPAGEHPHAPAPSTEGHGDHP